MHPPPLLRVTQDQSLEHGVVETGVAADLLVMILARDGYQGFLEAQHMMPVGLAPAGGRNYRSTGSEGENCETSESTGSMTEKLDLDAIAPHCILIEREQDDVTRF